MVSLHLSQETKFHLHASLCLTLLEIRCTCLKMPQEYHQEDAPAAHLFCKKKHWHRSRFTYTYILSKASSLFTLVHENFLGLFQEVDTALVKLYTETNSPLLQDLLSSENSCTVEDTITWLQKHEVNRNKNGG